MVLSSSLVEYKDLFDNTNWIWTEYCIKMTTKIVQGVLKDYKGDEVISQATSSYIGKVKEDFADAGIVVRHLEKFNLKKKPPNRLGKRFGNPEGVRVLELQVDEKLQ